MFGFAGLDLSSDSLVIDPRLAAPVAEPVISRALERPVRPDPHYGRTVQATLGEGEGMEVRIGAATQKLASGATLQLSM